MAPPSARGSFGPWRPVRDERRAGRRRAAARAVRRLGLAAAVGALTLVAVGSAARAAPCTVTLRPDGNTAAIQRAMDRPGRRPPVVCVRPGIYKGARLIATRSALVRKVGPGRAIFDAGAMGRVLTVTMAGVDVTFDGITLSGGRSDRGGAVALLAEAQITLNDCWLTGNEAKMEGGAIYAEAGTVRLDRSRVMVNRAPGATGLALVGTAHAVVSNSVIADNAPKVTQDAPIRLSGATRLELLQSTIAYNGGYGIFLQPRGAGPKPTLLVESSVVQGKPDAIHVNRADATEVAVFRSVLHGGIGFVALDLQSSRDIPGFNLIDVERYRPEAGSPAIALGRCTRQAGMRDLAGKRRGANCTAGALEARPADVRKTLQDRAKAQRRADQTSDSPW